MFCFTKISQESQLQSAFTFESQQYTSSQLPVGDSHAIAHGLCRKNIDACHPHSPQHPSETQLWHYISDIFLTGPGQNSVSQAVTALSEHLTEWEWAITSPCKVQATFQSVKSEATFGTEKGELFPVW